jgi:ArsR family metal-binding transcriptional regulator
MAKASSLRQGRDEVNEEDVSLLKALSVLWLSPYSGDEPSFRIMLTLPASTSHIIDALAPLYSRATVYRRLQRLEQLKAVKREGGEWIPNL